MDPLIYSVLVYIIGGIWALGSNDARIAASTGTIAYIILLLAQ